MFCPNCGNDCGDANFCSNCGHDLRRAVNQDGLSVSRTHETNRVEHKVIEYPEPPIGRYNNHDHDYIEIKRDSVFIYKKNFLQKPTSHEIPFSEIRCVTHGDLGFLGGFLSVRDKKNQSPPLLTDRNAYIDETSLSFSRYQSSDFRKVYDFLKVCADLNSPSGIQDNPYSGDPDTVRRNIEYSMNSKRAERKAKIAELDASGQVYCPRCLSTSVTANQKGFGFVRGALGASVGLDVGLIAGGIGSKKVICTCLKCGYKWKPGKK